MDFIIRLRLDSLTLMFSDTSLVMVWGKEKSASPRKSITEGIIMLYNPIPVSPRLLVKNIL